MVSNNREMKESADRRRVLKTLCVALGACYAQAALPMPTAPVVVNGSATFAQTGNALTVTNSNRAIINWNGFSIGRDESVRFVQPGASSSVLNRVLLADPSVLLGVLQSNGRVLLINPAGILVGNGARIDTAGFVASTLNLSNADYLAGRLNFVTTPGAGGVRVESGAEIRSASGGYVYLIAPQVDNAGLVSAPSGEVILAAGQQVEIVDSGTPGVRVALVAGGEAKNLGQLLAESGRVGMVGAVVRQQGVASADSLVREGGRVFLRATQTAELAAGSTTSANGTQGGRVEVDGGAMTVVSGSVGASGSAGRGGHVELLADKVGVLDGAVVEASGASGGGSVLVGGDYQGKNADVRNAAISYLAEGATLKADARDAGKGGKVIVWADDTTRAYGRISARGGANGGDGGFVEVSGKKSLAFDARVDTSAPFGNVGMLLLDPYSVTISGVGGTPIGGPIWTEGSGATTLSWSSIDTQLQSTDVTISTSDSLGSGDDITFTSGPITASATATHKLTLTADDNVWFSAPVSLQGELHVTATNGDINFSDTVTTQGNFTAVAGGNIDLMRYKAISYGDMSFTAGGDISMNSSGGAGDSGLYMNKSGGSQVVSAGADLSLTGGDNSVGGNGAYIKSSGTQDISAATLTLTGGTSSGNNQAEIWSQGNQDIAISGTLTVSGQTGSNENGALIKSMAGQTIDAGNIVLSAGAGSGDSSARIHAVGSQSIQTNSGGISLTGNSGSIDNEAVIESDTSQYIDIAGGLTIAGGGGGGSAGGAGLGAPTQLIIVNGNLTMTAGNGSVLDSYGFAAPAWIGYDADADVTLDVSGTVTLTGTNATNPAMIGAAVGTASVTIDASGAVSADTNSFLGNWDGSSGGALDVASTGGAISLTGRNWFDDVELTTGSGAVNFHTLNAGTTHIKSIDATGNIAVTGDSGSGAIALDTLTTSGASTVSVTSQKAILDDNGGGVANISNGSGAVSLTSVSGTPYSGELAISADIDSAGPLSATITGGAYGSIGIRDVGSSALTNATITASAATAEGAVTYYRYGDVNVGGGTSLMLTPKSGDSITMAASGNMTVSAMGMALSGGSVDIAAGGNLVFASGSSLTVSGDGNLSAGGDLTVSGGTVSLQGSSNTVFAGGAFDIDTGSLSASMGSLDIVASSARVGGTLSSSGDLSLLVADTFKIAGGSVASSSGDITFLSGGATLVEGSMTANGGSIYGAALGGLMLGNESSGSGTVVAGNGIVDLLLGGSGIEMYNGSYISSTDATQPYGGLITLFFPGLSGGGSMIDGVATFDGGYKVGGSFTTIGSGLEVIYGVLSNPVADAINAEIGEVADSAGGTGEIADSFALLEEGGEAVADGASGEDSFGSTDEEKQNAKKKPAQCSA